MGGDLVGTVNKLHDTELFVWCTALYGKNLKKIQKSHYFTKKEQKKNVCLFFRLNILKKLLPSSAPIIVWLCLVNNSLKVIFKEGFTDMKKLLI